MKLIDLRKKQWKGAARVFQRALEKCSARRAELAREVEELRHEVEHLRAKVLSREAILRERFANDYVMGRVTSEEVPF